jgi:hypothetical protein
MKRVFKWLLLMMAVASIGTAWLIYHTYHPANHFSERQLRPFFEAQEWIIYSLDPSVFRDESLQDSFHGFFALGSHRENTPRLLQEVVQELNDAAEKWTGGIDKCFNPRHGIRVSKDGKNFDLSICYECSRVHIYEGMNEVGVMFLANGYQQEPSPEKLNNLLLNAGIRLPMKPQHRD